MLSLHTEKHSKDTGEVCGLIISGLRVNTLGSRQLHRRLFWTSWEDISKTLQEGQRITQAQGELWPTALAPWQLHAICGSERVHYGPAGGFLGCAGNRLAHGQV